MTLMQMMLGTGGGVNVPSTICYLVVAGGASGGNCYGGGGGSGGVIACTAFPITAGCSIPIQVGGGGASRACGTPCWGASGTNSCIGTQIACGGGGGGAYPCCGGQTGGSGGGGSYSTQRTVGTGITGGNGGCGDIAGYPIGGGGGGAMIAGLRANYTCAGVCCATWSGWGGYGCSNNISGLVCCYAGGGGGATYVCSYTCAGRGGAGGGGNGGCNALCPACPGTAYTGGGGGGIACAGAGSGAGGSGVVIIAYASCFPYAKSVTGSPTCCDNGTTKVYCWTSSGSITF